MGLPRTRRIHGVGLTGFGGRICQGRFTNLKRPLAVLVLPWIHRLEGVGDGHVRLPRGTLTMCPPTGRLEDGRRQYLCFHGVVRKDSGAVIVRVRTGTNHMHPTTL